MNHIEEMMKTAGIDCTYCLSGNMIAPDCKNCFTAEKQLELLQLIASERGLLMKENTLTVLNLKREKDVELDVEGCFAQGLAVLATNLMNSGELNKQKVKEILEQ